MAKRRLAPENKGRSFRLNLVDTSEEALDGLPSYIQAQALKIAEKTTVVLRELYKDRADLVADLKVALGGL